ncbi:MAG: SMI1/KNR4 family protein [Gammaproteobacteria bacterium]|nr:SMI1/KNR4 family protein [Gammaproteobacteria bacterium]
MTDIDAAIAALRALNEPVPKPPSLPSEADVSACETRLGTTFVPQYRRFLLTASDVVLGTLEPATLGDPGSHTHLPDVVADARQSGVPDHLLPICEDNGDYYCLTPSGEVAYWAHDGPSDETWPDLATWIVEVWIGEHG